MVLYFTYEPNPQDLIGRVDLVLKGSNVPCFFFRTDKLLQLFLRIVEFAGQDPECLKEMRSCIRTVAQTTYQIKTPSEREHAHSFQEPFRDFDAIEDGGKTHLRKLNLWDVVKQELHDITELHTNDQRRLYQVGRFLEKLDTDLPKRIAVQEHPKNDGKTVIKVVFEARVVDVAPDSVASYALDVVVRSLFELEIFSPDELQILLNPPAAADEEEHGVIAYLRNLLCCVCDFFCCLFCCSRE